MCFEKLCKKFFRLPKPVIYVHIFAKFIFGIGLGALLATYYQGLDWQTWGWVLIILSIALAIPGAYGILKK